MIEGRRMLYAIIETRNGQDQKVQACTRRNSEKQKMEVEREDIRRSRKVFL